MDLAHTPVTQQLRSRGLVLTAAISVALISTGSAYLAMVAFGQDVLKMNAGTAYATAGVFELSLVTVALLAREAAKDNRPGNVLLALTWLLSCASGSFAAWHELFIGHPLGAGIFRFLVPLLAALMWHLALIGDRHLATGMSWSGMRQARRMHALFLSTEDLFRAQSLHDGSRSSRHRMMRAEAHRRRARAIALRAVPPTEMRSQVAAWSDAMAAVGDGTAEVARLHAADRRRLTVLIHDGAPRRPEPSPATDQTALTPPPPEDTHLAADQTKQLTITQTTTTTDAGGPHPVPQNAPDQTADNEQDPEPTPDQTRATGPDNPLPEAATPTPDRTTPTCQPDTSQRTPPPKQTRQKPHSTTDEQAIQKIRELDDRSRKADSRPATKRVVMEHLGCGSAKALRLMAEARQNTPQPV